MAGGAAIEIDRQHADREQRQAERARHAELRRRRDDRALDVGSEDVDARRPADQPRHLVGRHAHHEQEQQRREDRRPQQRQGDAGEHLCVAPAGHEPGLLHAHVEDAQRRPERQIGEREIVAGERPGHPGHRIDVQRRLAEPERRFEHRVAPADIRAEDEDPRHRHQQAGNRKREQRQRMKQAAAGRVAALDHPGDQRAHDESRDRGAEREDQRVAEQPQDRPARIGLDEIIERKRAGTEARILSEGVEEQRRDWDEHEPDGDDDAGGEQQVGQARKTRESIGYRREWSADMPRFRCAPSPCKGEGWGGGQRGN